MIPEHIRVKAGAITHLTDARYFAAMGVYWLGIDIDSLAHPVQEYQEIKDWVEGPVILPESTQYSQSDWEEFLGFVPCELIQCSTSMAIPTPQIVTSSHPSESRAHTLVSVPDISTLDAWRASPSASHMIVDITALPLHLLTVDQITGWAGIQICGSDEEKLGYKSYDELDDFFERLEE